MDVSFLLFPLVLLTNAVACGAVAKRPQPHPLNLKRDDLTSDRRSVSPTNEDNVCENAKNMNDLLLELLYLRRELREDFRQSEERILEKYGNLKRDLEEGMKLLRIEMEDKIANVNKRQTSMNMQIEQMKGETDVIKETLFNESSKVEDHENLLIKDVCQSRNISLSKTCKSAGCCLKTALDAIEECLPSCGNPNPTDDPKKCPVGYLNYKELCYKFHTECVNWQGARDTCKKEGGDLINLPTDEDAEAMVEIWKKLNLKGAGSCSLSFYVGVNDMDQEGSWKWLDGTPMKTTKWRPGEPNDFGGREDFAIICPDHQYIFCNDVPADHKYGVICAV